MYQEHKRRDAKIEAGIIFFSWLKPSSIFDLKKYLAGRFPEENFEHHEEQIKDKLASMISRRTVMRAKEVRRDNISTRFTHPEARQSIFY